MTQTPRMLEGLRHGRYGEVFLVYLGDRPRAEVYNSFLLNDCPEELWSQLDPTGLAAEADADLAILNGPRYWLMDAIGKVDPVEPILRDFGGIAMRRVATIELANFERSPYREVTVHRGASWHFDAGSPVHLLHGPSGSYVMQAYCVAVDPALSPATLPGLKERLGLPDGWRFETRTLDSELVVDTTARPARVLQDELQNTYCRID